MFQMIEQLAQAPVPVSHAKELYGLGAILLVQIGAIINGAIQRKKQAPQLGRELDKRLMPLDIKIDSLSGEVRDLKAHVIGPDGQNGLRSDVKDLRSDVKGLLERERLHGPYHPT